MKLTREIKTAILVIASILLFIWGYSFLKGRDLFNSYKTLYVEYDSVEGLSPAAPVTLNGLIIGKVNNISINEGTGKLLVKLQIQSDFPISKSSVASIYEPSFIVGKQIAIVPNFEDKSLAAEGETLKGDVRSGLADSVGDKLVPIQVKLEKLMLNADNLITGINNVLDKKAQEDLKSTLSELNKTMTQFHKLSIGVNSLVEENRGQIKGIVTNFNSLSDSLNKADLGKTVKNLNKTLAKVDGIMTGLESGKGTIGKMLNDDGLYTNLNKTLKEAELLLQDVRLYPTRYVNVSLFGKKNKPYKGNDTISKK